MSLALSMITNDAQAVYNLLCTYERYFDKLYITVADKNKKQLDKLQELSKDEEWYDKLVLTYFKWEDHFGKAREFNRLQIQEDYFFWMDSDDEISNPKAIPGLVKQMENTDTDVVYMLYRYMQNDLGEEIQPHWRERIVRTQSNFKWAQNRCHETLVADAGSSFNTDLVEIIHNTSPEAQQQSMLRNVRLLEMDFEETGDPRTAMFLGDNHMYLKNYDQAKEYLVYLLKNGGWEEDKYRAWIKLAEIAYQQNQTSDALHYCNAAEDLLPEFPDSYFMKASLYNDLQKPRQTYEWVKVGMSKPLPKTKSVTDPTLYEYRGIFMGCLAALELGKVEEAWQLFKVVRQRSPGYKLAKDFEPIITEAMEDTEAIKKIKWLAYYVNDRNGDFPKLLQGLPSQIVADPRLNVERGKFLPKKKWPEKSIVFYCGRGTEPWGADTLAQGMGGSEEAVVYLSRELAKRGWQVTVYCDREEEYQDLSITMEKKSGNIVNGYHVTYKPWTLLNPFDEFDVFIAWRNPQGTRGIKARVKGVDLHDMPVGHQTVTPNDIENTDKFFLKSQYQLKESLTPIPADKAVVVGNGIVSAQFDEQEM